MISKGRMMVEGMKFWEEKRNLASQGSLEGGSELHDKSQ
jgi:hypothetical protein